MQSFSNCLKFLKKSILTLFEGKFNRYELLAWESSITLYFACFGMRQDLEAGRTGKVRFFNGLQNGNSGPSECREVYFI